MLDHPPCLLSSGWKGECTSPLVHRQVETVEVVVTECMGSQKPFGWSRDLLIKPLPFLVDGTEWLMFERC